MNGGIAMAGTVDRTQYEKYEKLAVFIMPYVRPELIKTYNNFIKDRQPERFIYENYIRETIPADENSSHPKYPVTLQDMIAVSTYIALSQESVEAALGTYREYRRFYKRNLFKHVMEEIKTPDKMSPRNPQYLRNFAELKVAIAGIERSDDANTSIEAIMQDKYLEIDKWRSDTSAPITDFAFIGKRPVKQIANSFIYDITFESITIIINNFSGSIEGFNVKFPTDLTNLPIIGYSISKCYSPAFNRSGRDQEESACPTDFPGKMDPEHQTDDRRRCYLLYGTRAGQSTSRSDRQDRRDTC